MFPTFTLTNLKKILPSNRDTEKLYVALKNILPKYNIDTVERVSMFIGQCAHESGQFNIMTENLNYSVKGLLRTFGRYFNNATAQQYANKPEKIANRVYANRMNNGDEASGDGWRFRGQGFIQLTGRYNHEKFAKHMGISLDQELVYVRTLEGSIEAACWFWVTNGLNDFADRMDVKGATKRINGGFNGLEDRINFVRKAMVVFSAHEDAAPDVMKVGSRGEAVFNLQNRLTQLGFRVSADGIFGRGTEAAVKQLQRSRGVEETGIVDAKTRLLL